MRNVISPAEQRVVLDHISWSTYLGLITDSDHRRSRITYDRGTLEIMSPSKPHERAVEMIRRLILAFSEELAIDIYSVGSTTFKREELQRGFEADASFYLANASVIRHKDEIDLTVDPPPDLVIEVDISRSSIGKLDLYSGLRVPEVWRYARDSLQVHALTEESRYKEARHSRVLPRFPIDEAIRLLACRESERENQLMRSFRTFVRKQPGIV